MTTYIALLRGVNVGGNKMVKMAELRELLSELGYEEPKTLLQSGNAVFGSEESAPHIESRLEAGISGQLNVTCDVVVLSAADLRSAMQRNPWREDAEAEPGKMLVYFGKTAFDPKEIEAVRNAMSGPERIQASGKQLYAVFPDGVGRSKIDRTPGWNRLTKSATARNWNTVKKLDALARG